ncbi:MAG: AAA family ATPase [Clostridia bacterium]
MFNHKKIITFSDGYKQFLSILFSVGLLNLNEKIILIDEPEIHLHPSSIVSLRDKLLDIGTINKNSHIFISTHSVNMIDKSNLDLYYILDTKSTKSCEGLKNLNHEY